MGFLEFDSRINPVEGIRGEDQVDGVWWLRDLFESCGLDGNVRIRSEDISGKFS